MLYVSPIRMHHWYKSINLETDDSQTNAYVHMHVNCQQGMQMPRFKLQGGTTSNESYMNVPTPQHTTHPTPHHTIPALLRPVPLSSIARKRVSYAVSLTPLQRPSTCHPQLCAKSNFKYKICIHKCL